MGEAKRRRRADDIRPTGISLSEFMMRMEKYIGRVPCGSCRACCYHPHINIVAGDDTSKLDSEVRADGVTYLKRKPDGSCVHLGPKGCTVYVDRPKACRQYDCRLYSALDIGIQFNADRGEPIKAPQWLFRRDTGHDLIWQLAAEIAVSNCEPGADADIVLAYLTNNLEKIIEQAYTKYQHIKWASSQRTSGRA